MKVLILPRWYPTPDDPYQGCFVRDQALALSRAGLQVTVMHPEVTSFRSRLPARDVSYQDEGVSVLQARARSPIPRVERAFSWMTERLVWRMEARWQRESNPDLIHAHVSYPAGAAALRLGRRWGVPVVLTEHYSPFPTLLAHPWARKEAFEALAGATEVMAVSHALAIAMAAEGVSRPIQVVPNIVDLQHFVVTPLPETQILRLISVASLVPMKDHLTLLEAVRLAGQQREARPIHLTLVGEGPLRKELEATALRLGIADRVRFLGAQSREGVARALSESSALVVSSRAETFCVAAAEALCAGRPVISTRCGGPEDFLDARSGELVPVGDAEAMAASFHRLGDRLPELDPERLARKARATFSPSAVAARLLERYEHAQEAFRSQPARSPGDSGVSIW